MKAIIFASTRCPGVYEKKLIEMAWLHGVDIESRNPDYRLVSSTIRVEGPAPSVKSFLEDARRAYTDLGKRALKFEFITSNE